MPLNASNPFERARREQTNVLVSIAGPSGSGKTLSGLLLARGLAGPDGKIAVIDTENKRSRHYADQVEFDASDLAPPFAPNRYVELIRTAEAASYDVLVIDSDSHEWEGLGGVISMAEEIEARTGKPGLHCWAKPKRQHKEFVQAILQTTMHVVCCSRAKEKFEQGKDAKGKSQLISAGRVAIQEKDFIYEMTIGFMLDRDHVAHIVKPCFGIEQIWPADTMITTEHGKMLREWSQAGDEIDTEFETLLKQAKAVAGDIAQNFNSWFKDRTQAERARLKPHMDEFKSARAAAEEQAQLAEDYVDQADQVPEAGDLSGNDEPPVGMGSSVDPDKLLAQYRDELNYSSKADHVEQVIKEFAPYIADLTSQYQSTAAEIERGARDRATPDSEGPKLI